MSILNSFTFISLNGYYKGENEDTNWHSHGEEENEYSEKSLQNDNILLFGRKTYDMMHGFWPTPMAAEMFPEVAAGMNKAEKIVFSNSLKNAEWHNTTVMSGDIVAQVRKLKSNHGRDLTILGSGSIVSQFSDAGLIDTYQLMIDPIALPGGTPIFDRMKNNLHLNLVDSKVFKSGVVLLTYKKKK